MPKAPRLSFKTSKPTGRWKSFQATFYYFKLNGKKFGECSSNDLSIRLMVNKANINEDGNPNCSWKWIKLKKESKSIDEVKQFLTDNIQAILEKYDIHTQED